MMRRPLFPRFTQFLILALGVSVLAACEDGPAKTDSILFREAAFKDAQFFVNKASAMLDQQVRANPLDNLDTLVIVKDAVIEAKGVYQRREIANWKHPELTDLEQYLDQLEPELLDTSFTMLHELVDRTVGLRQLIEEAKNLPYSMREAKTAGMVDYLGDKYNEEIRACCLNDLGYIDSLLTRDVAKHKPLIVMIRSINDELGKVIREEPYAKTLKQQIEQLAANYQS